MSGIFPFFAPSGKPFRQRSSARSPKTSFGKEANSITNYWPVKLK
jgi:hypothetical protein